MRELEIYVHIPFCVRKCAYCDFLSAPASSAEQERYVEALIREIEMFPYKKEYRVSTVFLGGGTPSILAEGMIARILRAIRENFPHREAPGEITIECNPGTASREKLEEYRQAGINRISIGLQSADDAELALLGRIHTWTDFLETYRLARAAGFENINIDLMSALPGQSVASWERTLERVLALRPEHISAYSLIIEEGTPFYQRYHDDDVRRERGDPPVSLPSEEEERAMYRLTERLVGGQGMHRYEISNYALPGYECRHNIGYWTGVEYVGFGLGASSLLHHTRYRNTECMEAYLARYTRPVYDSVSMYRLTGGSREQVKEDILRAHGEESAQKTEAPCAREAEILRERGTEVSQVQTAEVLGERETKAPSVCEPEALRIRESEFLSVQDEMEEFMFLGLRLIFGVSEEEFLRRFARSMESMYGSVLGKLTGQGLLAREDGRVFLTEEGISVSNLVMAEFLF